MTFDKIILARGIKVEWVGDSCVVMVPERNHVIHLTDDAADVVRRVQAGHAVSEKEPHLPYLVACGIVSEEIQLSRRGVLRAGVIGAGAGVAALAMPTVAFASSPAGPPPDVTGGFSVDYVNFSGGGSNPITAFKVAMLRDGSNDLVDLGLTNGQAAVVTLKNTQTVNATFDASQRWFASEPVSLAVADFFDTHTIVFSIGTDTFTVEFEPEL